MFRSLIYFLFGCALSAFSLVAFSAGITFFGGSGAHYRTGTDPATVCIQVALSMSPGGVGTFTYYANWNNPFPVSGNKGAGNCARRSPSGGNLGALEISYNLQACGEGMQRDPLTGQCVPPPCQGGDTGQMRFDLGHTLTAGPALDWVGSPSPPDLNRGYCDGTCRVGIGTPLGCWKTTEGPPYVAYCSYETTKTGSTCSTSDSPPPTLDPIPCPSGTAPGAVNGVGGCYPVSETVTETAPPVPNPDGSSTTTTTTTNPDGTQTITSETTHPDGSKTVTITTGPGPGTGAGGGEGGEGGEGSEPVEFPAECIDDPSKCEDKSGKFEKGEKGTFDLAAANQEKQAALDALFEKWDEIREEMSEVWGGVNESNGSLPCLAQFMFLGTEVKMCIQPQWVDWLPKLVLLIAAIIAAFILFRE